MHFGAIRRGAQTLTGLGWGGLREQMFAQEQLSFPPRSRSRKPPLSARSALHPRPVFPESTAGTHHADTETADGRSAPDLGQPDSRHEGQSRADGVAHVDTHAHTDRSCEPARVGPLP